MYHDVGVRQRVAHRGLDGIGGAVALDDGLPGHAHDGIGEVVPAGLAQPQPTQLDVVAEALDGGRGARLGIGGCGVHQHARVLVDQPPRGREDEARDHERGDRVALLKAAGDGDHSAEHGDRAGHVAAKCNALERSAADLYLRAVRTETTMRETSTSSATPMTAKMYQRASSPWPPSAS